ncbi:phage tail assembly protein [Azotobacter chroococcum]|uniref:Tail assembly chaperone E/41/14-like protein n=1 Tax=Azotobacter chroococcum TaxID=353 RepID=A0A4R1PQ24_9GAMM|nr:phage tail assembly protein [Azotobacter chroococcum]TBV91307.1 phage tail assembly protein [Azotobacter chroococcum]TCL32539.1 tail assembly chaperone E/41/14-like protein [Azotobacter chroococcum]
MTQTTKTVTLDNPIVRGEQTITTIELRKPDSGSLRGVTLTDVLQMDVNALFVVLPRISTPALTKPELLQMDPADLLQLGSEVTVFLLPKSAKVDVSPAA